MFKKLASVAIAGAFALSLIGSGPAFAEDPPADPPTVNVDLTLQNQIVKYLAKKQGQYSFSVRELGGQQRVASLNETVALEPASTIKTFFAWLALREVDRGALELSTVLPSGLTLKETIRLMITVSDNDTSADLREFLGNEWINQELVAAGYQNTSILIKTSSRKVSKYVGKRTSTADLALLFSRVEDGTALSAASTKLLKTYLAMQVWRSRISSGVPVEANVLSKSGELKNGSGWVEADSAIVYGPTTKWVITIIGHHNAVIDAEKKIAALVYTRFESAFTQARTFPVRQFITKRKTYLRSEIDGDKVVVKIPKGRTVRFIHSFRNWWHVEYQGHEGYLPYQRLKILPDFRAKLR